MKVLITYTSDYRGQISVGFLFPCLYEGERVTGLQMNGIRMKGLLNDIELT